MAPPLEVVLDRLTSRLMPFPCPLRVPSPTRLGLQAGNGRCGYPWTAGTSLPLACQHA